jgi:hypothetical protein
MTRPHKQPNVFEVDPNEPIKCHLCGRVLKDPVSITRGVGPDCWAKLLDIARRERNPEC